MNKIYRILTFLLIIAGVTASFSSQAKIWRVNNRVNIQADFTSAQAAHDGANAGDTIFLEPSPNRYGSITLTKKLVIIGTGYFLDQNPDTQWKNNWPASLDAVVFSKTSSSSSEYSQIMGVTCYDLMTVNVPNITIRRNNFYYYVYISQVTDTISNISFCENFFQNYYHDNSFVLIGIMHDIIIHNNIFYNPYVNYLQGIYGTVLYNGSFKNNIIYHSNNYYYYLTKLNLENFIIQNNIMVNGIFYSNNNTFSYNIANDAAFGYQNGNQQYVDINTVFLFTGSMDGQYQLKEGSPAIGAGFLGVDCGAFGGPNPYVLSGMPPVPAIYDFNIGSTGSEYNVNMKVKSHK